MNKPQERDYTSHVAYTRALEEYTVGLESALREAKEALEIEFDYQNTCLDEPSLYVNKAIATINEVLK